MQKDADTNAIDLFISRCKAHNLKITPQRITIYKELIKSKKHPSADALYQSVRNKFPNISFDTVNRTLQTLAEIGIIDLVESFSGPKRFDPNMKNHHHLHCVSCGKIIDFENDRFNNLAIPEDARQGFTVLGSRVVIKGICNQCGLQGENSSIDHNTPHKNQQKKGESQ